MESAGVNSLKRAYLYIISATNIYMCHVDDGNW